MDHTNNADDRERREDERVWRRVLPWPRVAPVALIVVALITFAFWWLAG